MVIQESTMGILIHLPFGIDHESTSTVYIMDNQQIHGLMDSLSCHHTWQSGTSPDS